MVRYASCDKVGFPAYRVGSDGTVWSRWIKGKRNTLGTTWRKLARRLRYEREFVGLCDGPNHRQYFWVHRLVLECFRGPPPNGKPECRHLNGNKHDNRLVNLKWGNRKEQHEDMLKHGTFRYVIPDNSGEKCGMSKLTEKAVRQIRKQAALGVRKKILAERYGVAYATVTDVVSRRSWDHLEE